jgi:branched-chain amino acid transport system permease protein
MDLTIAAILGLDGLTNGAIYALVALALVLVFSVTRVIFIPQGEFVAFGALTLASLQLGKAPGAAWLLLMLAVAGAVLDTVQALREHWPPARVARRLLGALVLPLAIAGLSLWLAPRQPPLLVQVALTLGLVTAMGPLLYRLAYRALSGASVLTLLIVSVGVHFALTGKALRATSVNRTGARLMGISGDAAGAMSFTMAAFIGALSGLLISPSTTIYYDTGFLIGLKGFVAAVFGGLASFPMALAGAIGVGLIESFGSFWASAFKEVIVFTVILPVLLWRSFVDPHHEEH